MIFIDTNVAIDLRDDPALHGPRIVKVTASPVISLITRIELESGVERNPAFSPMRRSLLTVMLRKTEVVMLTLADVEVYGRLVAALGFDRRRVLDRLIASQVLSRGASLVTANAPDFADVPGLRLIAW
ncbi:MAG: PIN domain-containing protein [Thermaurantiacus sp.]